MWGCFEFYEMDGAGATDGIYQYNGANPAGPTKPYFKRTIPSTLYLYFNNHPSAFGWAIDGSTVSTASPDNYCNNVSQQNCPVTGSSWTAGILYAGQNSSSSSSGV